MTSNAVEQPRSGVLLPLLTALRWLAAGTLGGVVAGLLALGAGSRLAMRLVAVTAPRCAGLVTENGNRCGEITLEGTMFLVLFGGLFAGLAGGLAYVVVRPLLAGLGRWRGLVFGLLALAVFGALVIESDNRDFRLFGQTVLSLALFAALFPLFGVIAAPTIDAIARRLPTFPASRPVSLRTWMGYGLMAVAAFPAIPVALGIGGGPLGLLFLALVVGALVVYGWRARGRARGEPARASRRRVRLAGYLPLGVAVAIGLTQLVRSISIILRG